MKRMFNLIKLAQFNWLKMKIILWSQKMFKTIKKTKFKQFKDKFKLFNNKKSQHNLILEIFQKFVKIMNKKNIHQNKHSKNLVKEENKLTNVIIKNCIMFKQIKTLLKEKLVELICNKL